jgi:hypothetical protein
MKKLLIATLGVAPTLTFASPGAIDQYGCHKDSAGEYHCHGAANQAKRVHTLLGVSSKITTWFYSDGPANYFIGPAVVAEMAFNSVALRAGWSYRPLMFGASDYSLAGWDVGFKIGKGLSRLGKHGFVELGYFTDNFSQANSQETTLSSYQFGLGFIWNKNNWSYDAKVMFRDAAPASDFWNNVANVPTSMSDMVFSVGIYRRF